MLVKFVILKFNLEPKKMCNCSQWALCGLNVMLTLLITNEEISVKSRICDWQGHVRSFHFAEQPFCLAVGALSHLNNDVQQPSLACPALCAENHSTRKKTRCSKTTFTSRSAVKWKRILFGLVGLYATERQHLHWRPCRSTVTCLKTPFISWKTKGNLVWRYCLRIFGY